MTPGPQTNSRRTGRYERVRRHVVKKQLCLANFLSCWQQNPNHELIGRIFNLLAAIKMLFVEQINRHLRCRLW